ncbi:hypothetical protein LTR53_000053 [Teratosphaeriaceae sp. CCFEE 6253]|nr:hypothetical protein LTR53_000053 [Teratosphaeriaceae sp. CCFEE 6253]
MSIPSTLHASTKVADTLEIPAPNEGKAPFPDAPKKPSVEPNYVEARTSDSTPTTKALRVPKGDSGTLAKDKIDAVKIAGKPLVSADDGKASAADGLVRYFEKTKLEAPGPFAIAIYIPE